MEEDGESAASPEADANIGNPPFLGGKFLRDGLGDAEVKRILNAYGGMVPRETELVCYWFAKAAAAIRASWSTRVGSVATNSVRGGANRRVLDRICDDQAAFDAWADEPRIIHGANVRVSLVCFARPDNAGARSPRLNGAAMEQIFPDLTGAVEGRGLDLTQVQRLKENLAKSFMGDTKGGAFDVPGELAREWLEAPVNPNGRPNSDVLRPWINGLDVTRRPRDMWIVDFGCSRTAEGVAYFELPYAHIRRHVWPERINNKRESYRRLWWQHVEPQQGMWSALRGVRRYLATPTVARHRIFAWIDARVCPDHQLIVVARDDDVSFGILHSRAHELWSLRLCTWLGVGNDPRYTPSTTFETFPFPEGLTPNVPASANAFDPRAQRIAEIAKRLNQMRESWLNPPDLVLRVPEVVPGYPDRLLPRDEAAAKELKKRTLTNLYNQRPAWLDNLHRELDEAVAAAYGWPGDLSDEEILKRLLDLNQERAAAGR